MDSKRRPITFSPRSALLGGVIIVAALASHRPLYAHGDLPWMKQIFLEEGALVGGAVNYGLLFFDSDPPLWTTEDTLGSEPRGYHRLQNGSVLAAGFKGLFITHDQGCGWSAVPGFSEDVISSFIPVPEAPSTLILITASRDRPNGVFISHDNAATWSALGRSFPELSLQSAVVTPDGGTLWVQGNTLEEWEPVVVELSSDIGKWEPASLDLSPYQSFELLEYSTGTGFITGAGRTRDGRAHLLVSRDGLGTVSRAGSPGGGTITDYASLGDLRFVTTLGEAGRSRLWRSEGRAAFREVEGPSDCLEGGEDGVLWGCGTIASGGHVLRTEDGERWQAQAPFERACPRSCPLGTRGAELNPGKAHKMKIFGVGLRCQEPPPTAPAPEETSGGCQGGPRPLEPMAGLTGVALLFLLRRRGARELR